MTVIAKQVAMYAWDIYASEERDGVVVEQYQGRVVKIDGYQVLRALYESNIEYAMQEPYLSHVPGSFSSLREATEALR